MVSSFLSFSSALFPEIRLLPMRCDGSIHSRPPTANITPIYTDSRGIGTNEIG